jgi:hypothetical protein
MSNLTLGSQQHTMVQHRALRAGYGNMDLHLARVVAVRSIAGLPP